MDEMLRIFLFSFPGESANSYADLLMRNSEPVQGEISRPGDPSQAHCYARPCHFVSTFVAVLVTFYVVWCL